MRLLLALSPFIVFIAVNRAMGARAGLFAAAATSAALLLVDSLLQRHQPKILELGTLVLFGALALYVPFSGVRWSVASVRLAVDTGLLSIVLTSMLVGQPFTIQYAREQVAVETQDQPGFIRMNYVATAVWAAAFAVMVAVDCAWVMVPGFSPTIVLVVSLAAVLGALRFPRWYVQRTGADGVRIPG